MNPYPSFKRFSALDERMKEFTPMQQAFTNANICVLLFPLFEEFCFSYGISRRYEQLKVGMTCLLAKIQDQTAGERSLEKEIQRYVSTMIYFDDADSPKYPDLQLELSNSLSAICGEAFTCLGEAHGLESHDPRLSGIEIARDIIHFSFCRVMYDEPEPVQHHKSSEFYTEIQSNPNLLKVLADLESAADDAEKGILYQLSEQAGWNLRTFTN